MIPNRIVARYLVLIPGLIAFTFSGMNWNVGVAAWLAPVLLLYYSRNSKWTGILFLFIGLALSTAIAKTAENLSGLFLIYITTGLTYGLVYSLPYVLDKLLVKDGARFHTTLVFPAAVVVIEYLLSLAIGIWGNTAIAQFHNSNLIQVTSLFGVFGISFLVAWLASVLNRMAENKMKTRKSWTGPAIYGIVIITVLLFGLVRRSNPRGKEGSVRVAAVMGEADIQQVFRDWEEEIISLSKDYDLDIPGAVFSDSSAIESMIERTEEALSNGAEIVVWNEISLLLKQPQLESLVQGIKELCLSNEAYVLIAVLEKNALNLPKPFNNISILVDPEGDISWRYQKHFLNPLAALVVNKGEEPVPCIDTEFGRISNALCSDLDFSTHISRVGKDSVDILLVPAYDWKEVTPYHPHMAAFAAIQYGVNIVRANGKGITAIYDTRGNMHTLNNTFTSGSKIIYAELPLTGVDTVYSAIGNLFVYLWILYLIILPVIRRIKR